MSARELQRLDRGEKLQALRIICLEPPALLLSCSPALCITLPPPPPSPPVVNPHRIPPVHSLQTYNIAPLLGGVGPLWLGGGGGIGHQITRNWKLFSFSRTSLPSRLSIVTPPPDSSTVEPFNAMYRENLVIPGRKMRAQECEGKSVNCAVQFS